jgi:hypothetical protein
MISTAVALSCNEMTATRSSNAEERETRFVGAQRMQGIKFHSLQLQYIRQRISDREWST